MANDDAEANADGHITIIVKANTDAYTMYASAKPSTSADADDLALADALADTLTDADANATALADADGSATALADAAQMPILQSRCQCRYLTL